MPGADLRYYVADREGRLNSNRIMAELGSLRASPWTSGAAFLVLEDPGRLRSCDGVLSQRERDMATVKSYPARVWTATKAFREVESPQGAVYRRLKGSYGPTYLTILSVVQAVAMGDLAQVVRQNISISPSYNGC